MNTPVNTAARPPVSLGPVTVRVCDYIRVAQKDGNGSGYTVGLVADEGNKGKYRLVPFAHVLDVLGVDKVSCTTFNAYTRVWRDAKGAAKACAVLSEKYDIQLGDNSAALIRALDSETEDKPAKAETAKAEKPTPTAIINKAVIHARKCGGDFAVFSALLDNMRADDIPLAACEAIAAKLGELSAVISKRAKAAAEAAKAAKAAEAAKAAAELEKARAALAAAEAAAGIKRPAKKVKKVAKAAKPATATAAETADNSSAPTTCNGVRIVGYIMPGRKGNRRHGVELEDGTIIYDGTPEYAAAVWA